MAGKTMDLVPVSKEIRQDLLESMLKITSSSDEDYSGIEYYIKMIPNILVDIVTVFIKQATDNAREFSSHSQSAKANIQQLKPFFVLGWFLGRSPQVSNLIYNYFETSSFQPLPEEMFHFTSTEQKGIVYAYPGFDDDLVKNLLVTYFEYLSFNPKWFSAIWNWSELGRLVSLHPNQDIKYLAACCLSVITQPTRHQHVMFLHDVIPDSNRLIELQLKHASLFTHKKRPLVETNIEQSSTAFVQVVGKSESGIYDIKSESIAKVANALLPKRDISLGSNHFRKTIEKVISRYVPVSALDDALSRVAYATSISKPCLIRGPTGSGKTSILDFIAAHTNRVRPPDYIKVQVGDQIDSKSLVGSYVCTEIPGQFEWQAGPLTQALAYGSWIVFEDIDSAPADLAQIIHSVVENGNLSCVSCCPIKMDNPHPDFKIFFTQRTRSYDGEDLLNLGFGFIERLCDIVDLPELGDNDLKAIMASRFQFNEQLMNTILDMYHFAQKAMQDIQSARSNRSLTLTDLFKFCDRIFKKGIKVNDGKYSSSDLDGLLIDAIDCFIASLPNKHKEGPARSLGQILNKPITNTDSILSRIPDIRDDGKSYFIGRATIEKSKHDDTQGDKIESRTRLAHTRQTLQLIESVALCINNRDSVLLVGETGVGKTTIVQHLASLMNAELSVMNLSQQSDSSDLLGGVRPIDMREVMRPIQSSFVDLFSQTYEVIPNKKFLDNAESLYLSSKTSSEWITYLKLIGTLCSKALTNSLPKESLERWTDLSNKTRRLKKRLSDGNSSPMALTFTDGTLLQAVRKGRWILLDEINLAEPDVLQCLLLILDSIKDSYVYLQSGSEKDGPIFINPKFRIFACMNPSTDIGKRDLPIGIRGRFTEFFVDEVDSAHDLRLIVESYVKSCLTPQQIENIVSFYREIRVRSRTLCDIGGNSPVYSLRTLCRSLVICALNECKHIEKSLLESLNITFLQQLNDNSVQMVMSMFEEFIFKNSSIKQLVDLTIAKPQDGHRYIEVEKFWVQQSTTQECFTDPNYILTKAVKTNLQRIARILCLSKRRLPILIQGNTSVGKTSLIKYLAQLSGNKCYRINNHEHTDLQEYIGKYVLRESGELEWQDGLLTRAMRKGYWVILDELNLAPCELLEALNRVLDDNRELYIPETRERFSAHNKFVLFATQNPPEEYAGRKLLSRAFRNRFVELHFDELPRDELETILHQSCRMPLKYAKQIVSVMKELQMFRRESGCFAGKNSFMTMRDLFRWGRRYLIFKDTIDDGVFFDWDLYIASQGLILLEGRVRTKNEGDVIKGILEKVFKTKLDRNIIYEPKSTDFFLNEDKFKHIHFTPEFKRLYIQLSEALKYKEPVLLCGQTGCGKTTACQLYTKHSKSQLITYNCHANTESADFVGNVRPSRESGKSWFRWYDGPLVEAMKTGSMFLMDEISLADDAVLERINSVLEPVRSITLTEFNGDEIVAKDGFRFVATMNPGGDYGKKELSTALRNRFTEIYCHNTTDIKQIAYIMQKSLSPSLSSVRIAPPLLKTMSEFLSTYYCDQSLISLRDILSWVSFLNETMNNSLNSSLSLQDAVLAGACLVFFDQFGTCGHRSLNLHSSSGLKEELMDHLRKLIQDKFGSQPRFTPKLKKSSHDTSGFVRVCNFYLRKGSNPIPKDNSFVFTTPTVEENTKKLVRALQLERPVLLEGDPGAGKTSIVAALARRTGHKLVRINLSDQTDISDLFGSDLPDPSRSADEEPQFCWHDGPMLKAIKESSWILLDEMNLASQSVLEGLNACFDHRGQIYISELNKTFSVNRNTTKIFACQNPYNQGSARKGLPQSFINRFTSIYIAPHTNEDLALILTKMYPQLSEDLILKMVLFNTAVSSAYKIHGYEFNLRDLIYWCDLMTHYASGKQFDGKDLHEPERFVQFVYIDRMRSLTLRTEVSDHFEKIFGYSVYEPPYREIKLGEYSFFMARASLPRKTRLSPHLKNLCILKFQMPYLESMAKAIEFNKMPILIGEPGVGKKSMIKILAGLTGNKLNVVAANRDMDTVELLGSYEQKSLQREMVDLVDQATKLALFVISTTLNRSKTESLQRLYKHVWSTLYSTSVREHRLSKHELMETYRFQLTQLETLIEKSQPLCINHTSAKCCKDIMQMISVLKKRVLFSSESTYSSGNFEWIDSTLIKSIREGDWLLIENANLMNPATLDRLNSLIEPNGVLSLNEKGSGENGVETIRAHPDFRIIMTMDPNHGELSRAMRNRGVEIYIRTRFYYEDFLLVLNSVGMPMREGTACMNYCIMQTSCDAHVKFTGERPEDDGALLAHFGLNYSDILSHQMRRGVALDNVLAQLFITYYRQNGYLRDAEDQSVKEFINERLAEYRDMYVVVQSDERYKWLNFRHDLKSMTGGDAIPTALSIERKLLKEWSCPLSIGLLKFDELIDNVDIVFYCTAIKIFMELSSPSDFDYRKSCVESQYSMLTGTFFTRMLELVQSEIGPLQQECLPMIVKELPTFGSIQSIDMFVDTRNSPDLHYTLLSIAYLDTLSREDLQNRWVLSLYRINLSMITDQIEKLSIDSSGKCTSLYELSERVKSNQMLQQDLIRQQAMIASDLYDILNGLLRYVSNRCFPNNLVVKLMGRLFWISYFQCKLKRACSKEELIAICNQIPMLWALTYQKVIVPLIEDCELADVLLNGKKLSSRIKHICDFLDVNITKPSKIEKGYYHKIVNRYAASTKISETLYREMEKLFTTLISRYTIKSQAMDFMEENSATLAASNLVWSNSTYMSALYRAADLILGVETEEKSFDGNKIIESKINEAKELLCARRDEYETHEQHLEVESSYRDRCLTSHKRRCALDQFAPIWQIRFVHGRLSEVLSPNTHSTALKRSLSLTRRMLSEVNGILMSPRYFSTLNKFIDTKVKMSSEPSPDESITDVAAHAIEAKKNFDMCSVFLIDHMLENVVLDNQVVGWIKMRVTTSDLSSSAPIMPEYSPLISLVSSYCLDLSHLKLNSYHRSSPQLESMLAYLWRAYAQIKSGSHNVFRGTRTAHDFLHLRLKLDNKEDLIGNHKCSGTVSCGCLDEFNRLRTSKYDENVQAIKKGADPDDRSLLLRAHRLIHFGFYHMLEYAPIFTLDPSLRSREKSEVYKAELAHAKIDLHLRNTLHYWKTGENLRLVDITPEEAKLYPFSVRAVIQRRAKLERSLKKLRIEFTNRPKSDDGSLYYELRKEVEITVTRNTTNIATLINDLLAYLNATSSRTRTQKLSHLNSKCRMLIKNLERSIARFRSDFVLYNDLTTHYLAGFCFILQGIRLLYSRIEQKIQLVDMSFKHCLVDKFSSNMMRLFSFNNFTSDTMSSVNQKRRLYPLLPVICHEDTVSHAQSLLLRSILLQLNHHIIITPSDIKLFIPIVRNVADQFHKAWLERKKFLEDQRKKHEDLYEYRVPSMSLGYQTSLERKEFLEIANKFPVYDHIYHENIELPHNDMVNLVTEAKIINLKSCVDLSMCLDVCKAHYKFMKEASLNLLSNQDINTHAQKSRDIEMGQLVKLEAEILYKVIRKCIANLDSKFDSISLECHILQANELIKTLRQSQPDQLQTGTLRSSIEILDEEIFDIYHDPCPYETLRFQELLTRVDSRINIINSSKVFEKHPTLASITRLTNRISSFLITDPLMKFVTGAHALLQLLEEWNKVAPRDNKMIKEADDLIILIHSWRGIELKSWRSSLHRVKRKYIDDTLCDLWFRLYEDFNDPLTATKQLLVSKDYEESEVMDLSVDEHFYHGFAYLIKIFLEEATLGDYQIRLDLVFSFAIQTRFASLYEQSKSSAVAKQGPKASTVVNGEESNLIDYEKLTTYVHNIYRLYQGLMNSYKDVLAKEESELATELDDEIRVVNWQGRNLWEIKNNFRISHRKLNKVMNKYLEVLKKPVADIGRSPSVRLVEVSVNESSKLAKVFDETHKMIISVPYHRGGCSSTKLISLKKVSAAIPKMLNFEEAIIETTKDRYVSVITALEDAIASNFESIKAFGEQRAQDLVIHDRDSKEVKADKLKTCRQIYHSKKFAMQTVFKNLYVIGVSYQRGLARKDKLDGSILSLEPLRGMIQNQSQSVLKAASALVEDSLIVACNEMYREVLTKNQSLLNQPRRPDLSGDQFERIQGLALDMILDITEHNKNAALIYRHLMDIQASYSRLHKLRVANADEIVVYNFERFHAVVKQFNELTSRTYLSLSKLELLLDCQKTYYETQDFDPLSRSGEDLQERKILHEVINDVHKNYSLLTDDQHMHVQNNLDQVRTGLARISSELRDKLKHTIRNYLYGDDDVQDIQRLFGSFMEMLNLLIPPNSNRQINARPGTVLGAFVLIRADADKNLKPLLAKEYFAQGCDHIDLDSHSKLDKLDIRLQKLLKQVKLVAQDLYKEETVFSADKPTSESAKRSFKPFNHIDSRKLRDLLRASGVAKHISNCFMTLNLEDRSLDIKLVVSELEPILSIYTRELSRYINVILGSMHVKLMSANQLVTFFYDVAVNGFGLPCKIEELKDGPEDGSTNQNAEDNVGFGEGQGKNDASKKLEYESQLDETKTDDKDEDQSGDNADADSHVDAHDDGVEMTDDFDAKAEGPDPKDDDAEADDDGEADDERLNDIDKEFDEVDQDDGHLDEQLWDDKEEDLGNDDEEDLRDADFNESIKHDEKDLMAKNAELKEDRKSKDDKLNEVNGDEQEEENEGKSNANDEANPDAEANPGDDAEVDQSVEMQDKSDTPGEEDGDDTGNPESDENKLDLDDDDPILELIDQDSEFECDNDGKSDEVDMDMSDVSDDDADIDLSNVDEDTSNLQPGGPNAEDGKADQIAGEDVEMQGDQNEDLRESAEMNKGSSAADGNEPGPGDDEDGNANRQQAEDDNLGKRTFADRTSLETNQQIKRQKIEEATSRSANDESEAMEGQKERVKHIEEDTESAIEVIDLLSDSDDERLLDANDLPDQQSTGKPRDLKSSEGEERKTGGAQADNKLDYLDVQRNQSTYNTNLGLLKYISHGVTNPDHSGDNTASETNQTDLMKHIDEALKQSNQDGEHESIETDKLTNLWLECTQSSAHLVNELCQQLQIVLQPTKMSKYKGDYKSGKRLNMRKIISYIASQYRKDKIWMRRTKPCKRTYNISLAVDNSSSMSENNCRQMTYQSLALLAKSLSIIEAGSLNVVSFGEQVQCIHEFDQPYVDAIGAQWLRELRFNETKTSYARLLRHACIAFANQARHSISNQGAGTSVNQFLIIISDGRNVTSEGEEVKSLLRQLKAQGVLVLFLIIDDLKQNNGKSIIDVKSCVQHAGKMRVEDYMDLFPFPFYVLLRQIDAMPSVLGDALRQWFELVSGNN